MKELTAMGNGKNENLGKWYNFWISEEAETKSCYIDFSKTETPCSVKLCLYGKVIAIIDYYPFWKENLEARECIHKEKEIVDYIYKECRKYEKNRKIYVNKIDTEILSVAGDLYDFMTDAERVVEDYFLEKEFQEQY